MARIVTDETSLTRQRKGMLRESVLLRRILPFEFVVALLLMVTGIFVLIGGGRPGLLIGGGLLLGAAFAHRLRLKQNHRDTGRMEAGLRGEAAVTKSLDRVLDNQFYIFNDQVVRSGLKRAQLDHVVVSPYGIFVLETKNWRGRISGTADGLYWQQVRQVGDKPRRVSSPILQIQRSCRILEAMLKRAGVQSDIILPLIVFRAPDCEIRILDSPVPICKPESAAYHIASYAKQRYFTDDQVDAILNLFMETT